MNYEKIYKNLFQKAKKRNKKEFIKKNKCVENHHFIPKSLFSDKSQHFLSELLETDHFQKNDNVYPLTCREHFLAHLLLYKIFKGSPFKVAEGKMGFSFQYMCKKVGRKGKYRVNSVFYEKSKEIFKKLGSKVHKGKLAVKDKRSGEILYVTKKEYKNNKNLESVNKNKSTVYDTIEKKMVAIDRGEYLQNKERYKSANFLSDANKKTFICDVCGKEIKGYSNFSQHKKYYCKNSIEKSPNKIEVCCIFCKKIFIRTHIKTHTRNCKLNPDNKRVQCPKCGKEISEYKLNSHIGSNSCIKEVKRIEKTKRLKNRGSFFEKTKCEFCGRMISINAIKRHKNSKSCKRMQNEKSKNKENKKN